jgi:YD repeat-containing protein
MGDGGRLAVGSMTRASAVQMRAANGGTWKLTFDAEDRPLSMVDPNGASSIVTYDVVGNVIRLELQPGNVVSTFE